MSCGGSNGVCCVSNAWAGNSIVCVYRIIKAECGVFKYGVVVVCRMR